MYNNFILIVEEKWHLPVLLTPEKVPLDFCPSGTCFKICQWIFSYDLAAFQAAASVLELGASVLYVTLQEQGLGFLQPSSSPWHKPCWFPKPDVMEAHLPNGGPLDWGVEHVAGTPCSSPWLCYVSCLWAAAPGVWVLTRLYLCSSYLSW